MALYGEAIQIARVVGRVTLKNLFQENQNAKIDG